MQPQSQYPQYPQMPDPPYGLAPTQQHASWFNRVGSYIIDWLPVSILTGIGSSILSFNRGDGGMSGGRVTGNLVFSLLGLAVLFYNRWYRAGKTGKSWGKSVTGSRLIAEATGAPIGVGRAFLRDICHILDSILYIGFLWPLWDRKRQTFADKIMKTVVVRP